MTGFTSEPGSSTSLLEQEEVEISPDKPWQVILSNDPVNLQPYVTKVIQKVLKLDKDRAEMLMLVVHNSGEGAVKDGTKEECTLIAEQFRSFQLWARAEQS